MEFLTRLITTAVIVVAVSLSAHRIGPRIGGILVGLPIIMAPGYFFLIGDHSPDFIADSAVSTLYALTATLAFVAVYVAAARVWPPVASIATAIAGWLIIALAEVPLPREVLLAGGLFAAAFAVAMAARYRRPLRAARSERPLVPLELVIRGCAAGLLVGIAAPLGRQFGPVASGLVLAFPMGMTTIALTLHQKFGATMARATMASAQGGMLSLGVFAAVMATAPAQTGEAGALVLALVASLLTTVMLMTIASQMPCEPEVRHD